MKKTITRIAACSLAVLIAFNTVAIPTSKAVAFGSQFASAVTAAFMTATGFSMNVSGDWNGTSADMYIADRLDGFLRDFAEAREMTKAQFEELIYDGVEIVHGGLVKISSGAVALLSGFSDWLIDKLGLIPSGDSVFDGDGVTVLDEPFRFGYGSTNISAIGFSVAGTIFDVGVKYVLSNGTTIECYHGNGAYSNTYFYVNGALIRSLENNNLHGEYYTFAEYEGESGEYSIVIYVSTVRDDFQPYRMLGTALDVTDFGEGVFGSFPLALSPDYEAPPAVEEQYSMVIDTGMTFADEQAFIDSILAGAAAGTLNPTYDIEETENRDVVVPGEVTDTQAGILSWVKTIAQRVTALPRSISESVKGIFVPDAALTTEITSAFSEKFSFVPTLHRLGTDLLSIGPDSKPPVVYIHLEDAEGTIDYGGTVKALDMSWYERYKEDGDRIIGGFLWLGFLWLLFKRVPAIINGGEMVQEYTADIDRGSKRRKH